LLVGLALPPALDITGFPYVNIGSPRATYQNIFQCMALQNTILTVRTAKAFGASDWRILYEFMSVNWDQRKDPLFKRFIYDLQQSMKSDEAAQAVLENCVKDAEKAMTPKTGV